jgi:hypothetical protein
MGSDSEHQRRVNGDFSVRPSRRVHPPASPSGRGFNDAAEARQARFSTGEKIHEGHEEHEVRKDI